MTTKEKLIAARALIADPETWTQHVSARDVNGEPVDCEGPEAASFCVLGALVRVGDVGDRATRAMDALDAASGHDDAMGTNDYLGHEATLAMFDRAIEAA